jgi:hypothetical protein
VPDALFYDGSSSYEMRNKYSLLYDSVMQKFVDEYLNGDGVLPGQVITMQISHLITDCLQL